MKTMEKRVLRTLEVIVSFDGAVLGVHHLRPGQRLRLGPPAATAAATRGRARHSQPDYTLDGLGAEVELASHGAVPQVVFPSGAQGLVTLQGGESRTVAQLLEQGLCEAVPGGLRYALPAGAAVEITLGALSARVAESAIEGRTVPGAAAVDWRAHRFSLAAMLLQGGVLGLAMLAPPDPRALAANDLSRLDNETLRTRFIPAVVELKQQVLKAGSDGGGAAPKPAPGARGQAGSRKAQDRLATTLRDPKPTQRNGLDLQAEVRKAGVLAIMGQGALRAALGELSAPESSALGKDADAVLTGLQGNTDHLGWGTGGAHLVDTGPGGGCTGPDCGTVAVNLNGICDGGDCRGLDRARRMRGPALTTRTHRPETPDPRLEPPTIVGGLDKELVRRVIRSRMNEFKFCYERELVRAPELQGRVVMSFLIARDGRVVSAAAKESTMPSPAVHGCLSQAVQRLSFPMPQGAGLVQVSYPFVFHSN